MAKVITIKYDINGKLNDVDFYIGNPAKNTNPVYFQQKIISEMMGGSLPKEIKKSFDEVKQFADNNNISFVDVFSYLRDEYKMIENEE